MAIPAPELPASGPVVSRAPASGPAGPSPVALARLAAWCTSRFANRPRSRVRLASSALAGAGAKSPRPMASILALKVFPSRASLASRASRASFSPDSPPSSDPTQVAHIIDLSTASHRDPHGTVQVDLQWRPGTAHAIQGVRASDLAGSPDRLEPALPGDPHHPVAAPVGGDEVAPGRKARVKGQGGGQERGGGMAGGGESHGSSRKEVVGPERSKLEVNISIII